jgi:acyl-CoA synthetase
VRPFLTLHHPATARDYYARGLWREDTLYGLLDRHARERPDVVAAGDGRLRLCWRALRDRVDGVALALARTGVQPGDRTAIWSDNRLESIVFLLATGRVGAACNPGLHRTYTSREVATLLERLSVKVLLTRPGWGGDAVAGEIAGHLAASRGLKAVWTVDSLPGPAANEAAPCADPDKVAYLAFTSGTTGAPKCVMHSDNTLLANARDLARDWGHGPATRILTLSPLSHHIAWVAVAQWLLTGATLFTDDPPPGASRLDWLMETEATYVLGVPTHAMDILAEQRRRGLARLGRVDVFYMAGAPIPPSVAQAFVAQGIRPQNVYGMTENSSHQYTHPGDAAETVVATCGRGGAGYQVRLFDPADPDRAVEAGTVGEIAGRGAALMLGYFDDQAATESSFNRDGWFRSGDLGVLDAAGNLRIEGRIKDLIIRGGHNIHPAHIEALALRHPGVARCAAFPVADERLGERVCLAVAGTVKPDDLLRHLAREGLSKYDMPEYFVAVEAFPLTASGKILKRELVEMTRRGELEPQPIRYARQEEVGT